MLGGIIDMGNKSPDPQDGRQKDCFGPKFYVESGNPAQTSYGPEAFCLKGTNDDNTNVLFTHHENNTTRLETQGVFEFTSGCKADSGSKSIMAIAQKGDIHLNAAMGGVHIKANSDIVLEAKNIVLKGVNIQVGDQFAHGTKEINLNATKIEVSGSKGNLPEHLGLSVGAKICFGPGGFVGQAAAAKTFNRISRG